MKHTTQHAHDLVIDYSDLRHWVREHCGVALPEKEIDVGIEANEGKLKLTWSEPWREQPIALPARTRGATR
jgi:hypothetical protein